MKLLERLWIGVLLGVVAGLLIHPITRDIVIGPWLHLGPSKTLSTSPWSFRNSKSLMTLDSPEAGAFVLTLAADDIVNRRARTQTELKFLAETAKRFGGNDPDNAFWFLMESYFLYESGDKLESKKTWIFASKCKKFDDFQVKRLEILMSGLREEYGPRPRSWQGAALYRERAASHGVVMLIHSGRVRAINQEKLPEVDIATWRVGYLLMRSGRMRRVGEVGVRMMQRAASEGQDTSQLPISAQISLRNRFIDSQTQLGRSDQRAELENGFRQADSWSGLVTSSMIREAREPLLERGLLLNAVAPVGLVASFAGFIVYGLGVLLSNLFVRKIPLPTIVLPLLAVGVGAFLFVLSGSIWAGFSSTLVLLGLSFSPGGIRSRGPKSHQLEQAFCAVSTVIIFSLFSLFVSGFLSSTVHLREQVPGALPRLMGATSMLWLTILSIVFLIGLGGMLGLRLRIQSYRLIPRILRRFGRYSAILGLFTVCIGAMMSLVQEPNDAEESWRITLNEPAYILSR